MIHSYFYPRSPCGERLAEVDGEDTSSGDFYPRSPCGERPTITGIIYSDRKISIHALLAESDRATSFAVSVAENFYPRSPCGERHQLCEQAAIAAFISIHALLAESDLLAGYRRLVKQEFLSTLSLRRATVYLALIRYLINFYPRSPCGERRKSNKLAGLKLDFYPRSPCGERPGIQRLVALLRQFLSTLSLRRATPAVLPHPARGKYFYPRSPCGERPVGPVDQFVSVTFLSTLSLRRATG